MGLERLVEAHPADYIGKSALEQLRRRGADRKLVGVLLTVNRWTLSGVTAAIPCVDAKKAAFLPVNADRHAGCRG